jgi:hypothetical protein
MLRVAYGPPGVKGVTTLMSVGDADDATAPTPLERFADVGGKAALVVWVVSLATGNRTLDRVAFWGGMAALGARLITRK